MTQIDDELKDFKEKYEKRLKKELKGKQEDEDIEEETKTRDYEEFRKQYMPKHMSWYEKACQISEQILKITPDKKKIPEIEEAIKTCHLQTTPTGVMSFAILVPMLVILGSMLFGFIIPYLLTGKATGMFFILVGMIMAMSLILPLQKIPFIMANKWRLKASNQMVLSVFYIVTFMRHTSNLELAIDFAAEHLAPPLSIDLKKIIWDIETEKYDSIKESLDQYLMTWRKWNMEYIESMHLIESSLYESSESRRLDALDKALKVILEETYEKMLHYAHNLKGPITTLHMLGIILPILGLVILPLIVSFMPEVKWYHLFMLYNITLPIIVYYLGSNILSTRPTGYGQADLTTKNPELKKYQKIIIKLGKQEIKISPLHIAIITFIIFFIIGLTPLILHSTGGDCADWTVGQEGVLPRCAVENPNTITFSLLDYRDEIKNKEKTGRKIGPYGLGATLLSFAIPLAFGLGIGLYYKLRSKNIIKIRERAKQLEEEFASALFQLGNRLGDGFPAEIAFAKVAKTMEGTVSGKFFELVSINIQKLGFGIEKAIFDEEKGALKYYPSDLIESSMKVLVESSKKGPMIASQALMNIAEYIKEMHRVDERLKDLMADVISSMKSQINFLTPAISGIVIGITSMITQIIGTLGQKITTITSGEEAGMGTIGGASFILDMFGNGIPTYYFQIIVGLYVVEIVFILTILINGIQNGADKLNERFLIGRNLIKSTTMYVIIAMIVTILFSIVAGSIIKSVGY